MFSHLFDGPPISFNEEIGSYGPILLFIVMAALISGVVIMLPRFFARNTRDHEKSSPYECGFAPFKDGREMFDIKFYLVAVLFIIFDLEITFLFPWAVSIGYISIAGFWSMMIFLFVLTVGFIYEWKKGALEWR